MIEVHSPSMATSVTLSSDSPIASAWGVLRALVGERSIHSPSVSDVTSQMMKSFKRKKERGRGRGVKYTYRVVKYKVPLRDVVWPGVVSKVWKGGEQRQAFLSALK